MNKVISVKFPNGEIWHIPAGVVAANRAAYYSELDFARGDVDDRDAAYNDELEYALSDDAELLDYFRNNMDWNEVQAHAVKVPAVVSEYDYAEEFDNATFTVQSDSSET